MSQKTTAPDAKWNPWLRPSRIRKKAGPRPVGGEVKGQAPEVTARQLAYDQLPREVKELVQHFPAAECENMVLMLKEKKLTKRQLVEMLRRNLR